MLNFRCGRTPTSLLNYIYVLLIQAKVEACPRLAVMHQIQGGKGEAVVNYCEPLTTKEMEHYRLS